MPDARVPLHIEQGSSWSIAFPVLNGQGDPMTDLSGWAARAQVRPTLSSADILFEWSTAGDKPGRINLENGQCELVVRAEQSSAWPWRRGIYDLELIAPNGDVWRPVGGRVWVRPEVTR